MGERSGDKDQFRISDAQMRLMTGVDLQPRSRGVEAPKPQATGDASKTRVVKASTPRVMALCLGPLIPGIMLVLSAFSYYKTIPPGDMTTRYLAVSICALMAGTLFGGAAYLYLTYTLKTFTLEPKRIVVLEGDSLLTASWAEVVAEPMRGGAVKTFVFSIAGRPKSIDSVFFPDFPEIVEIINERVRLAAAALNDQTHVV